jgi:hypothetical protein
MRGTEILFRNFYFLLSKVMKRAEMLPGKKALSSLSIVNLTWFLIPAVRHCTLGHPRDCPRKEFFSRWVREATFAMDARI